MLKKSGESNIQKAIFRYLVQQNFLVIRVNSGAITQNYKGKERHFSFVRWQESGRRQTARGLADILALAPWGQLFAIECKAKGKIGRTSDIQLAFLEAVENRQAVGLIADSLEDVIAAIAYHRPSQNRDPASFM